jgi:hypothetical protein
VDLFLNHDSRYPIIIIIIIFEEDFTQKDKDLVTMSLSRSQVIFERVEFEIPSFLNKDMIYPTTACSTHSIGYRHMCRFHAGIVLNHIKGVRLFFKIGR